MPSHPHREPMDQKFLAKVEEKMPKQEMKMGSKENSLSDRGPKNKPQIRHSGHVGQGNAGQGHHGMLADFKQRLIVSLILTGPVLLLSTHVQQLFGFHWQPPGSRILLFLLSSAVYFYGGYPFLAGLKAEFRKRQPGMMTLVAVAITVAYVCSFSVIFGFAGMDFFWELVTLIDIMLLGHWIEMRSTMGASRALEELAKILPSQAHLIKGEQVHEVDVSSLKPEDYVLVKPGEKYPSDGRVLEGATDVNESALAGESQPVIKRAGDEGWMAGSINGSGAVTVAVSGKWAKDQLPVPGDRAGKSMPRRDNSKRLQNLADKAAFVLTVCSFSGGQPYLSRLAHPGRWFCLCRGEGGDGYGSLPVHSCSA